MSVAHSLLREIIDLDNLYYKGRDLPSSLLPNEAEIYLEAFGEARTNIKTPTDYNFVAKAELAWDHFIDPTGKYEMSKTLNKTIISKFWDFPYENAILNGEHSRTIGENYQIKIVIPNSLNIVNIEPVLRQ